ncbi:hypothetical protein A0257_04980 [Hymenobacter psoromatis]|nr:hypothetical protein A0257_04980 [Hymenobacter psoromatis]
MSSGTADAQAFAQPPADAPVVYSVPQLRADLTFLRQALEEVHPGLYCYTPKDSLDQAFARAAAQLTQPLDEPAFWRILQPLAVRVRCGHTRVQHSATYRAWARRQPHYYFPFTVAVRQDRLFVAENQSADPSLRPGTELLAIEGHSAREVLPRLRALISADGYGTGFQDKELEAGFFDDYYATLYEAKPTYRLTVRDSTGQVRELIPLPRPALSLGASAASQPVAPLPAAQVAARRLARLHSVEYPANLPATAILRLRSFDYEADYQAFHAAFFTELARRRTKRLVIDLRGNPGGSNALAVDLLKYLLPSAFVLTKSARARVVLPSFMSADSGSRAYFDTTQVRRLPDGTLTQASAAVGRQLPYQQHRFRGQVVLLVDGGTFSAASSFAASLRAQRRVLIVGQETGGTEAGLNGGVISRVELPQTRMVLQLPHFRLLTACRAPHLGRGVRPDVEVVPTPRQAATHADAILSQLPALLRCL